MTLHGQLTVEQEAKVTKDVSWLNDGRADLKGTIFRYQMAQRSSRAEPDKLCLGGIELQPA